MKRPRCSVLIPSYNRPAYLRPCLEGFLKSQRMDIEILVSDDCSPSQTQVREVADGLNDGRLRFFFQNKNLGWSNNRNFLINEARGEYLLLLGDDDLLDVDALLEKTLDRGLNADIIGFGYHTMDDEGRTTATFKPKRPMRFNGHGRTARRMLGFVTLPFDCFHPFTMLARREVMRQLPFDPVAHTCDDLLFLIGAAALDCSFHIVPEALFRFRVFEKKQQQGNLSGNNVNNIAGRLRIFNHLNQQPKDPNNPVHQYLCSPAFARIFCEIPVSLQRDEIRQHWQRISELSPPEMMALAEGWMQRPKALDYLRFMWRKMEERGQTG